ncbi:MAG: hypothetical protein K8U57_21540 [Planctomycetes bacterium]|nr:hypothetical protein [Planctomycetota bacterium]
MSEQQFILGIIALALIYGIVEQIAEAIRATTEGRCAKHGESSTDKKESDQ